MDNLTKLAQIITNSFTILGQKIDSLVVDIKNQKSSVQQSPQIKVNVPDVIVPPIEIPAPIIHNTPLDTTKIEEAIRYGMSNQKYPIIKNEVDTTKIENVIEKGLSNIKPPIVSVEATKVEFPKEMEVKGIKEIKEGIDELVNKEEKNPLEGISLSKPLPIMVVDEKGKQITDFGGEFSAPAVVGLKSGLYQVSSSNPLPVADSFQIPKFDEIALTYSGTNIATVVYKLAGVTVATLTLSYTSGKLTSVVKT